VPAILLILGGVFVILLVTGEWMKMRERRSPLRYRSVAWHEVDGHIRDFARRGYHRCQMIILAEGTDMSVRLRKTIELAGGFCVKLIAEDEATCRPSGQSHLKKTLDAQGIPFGYGPGGFRANPYGVFAQVGDDIELAVRAARAILGEFYGLDEGQTYVLWVRGDIDFRDICIDSVWVPGLISAAVEPTRFGRPYKHYHMSDYSSPPSALFYALGRLIGLLVRLIRRVLGRR